MKQYDKAMHQTYFGSFCTLLIYPFLMFLTVHMIVFFDTSSQDQIYQSIEIYNNSHPNQGMNMNDSGLIKMNFKLMLNNEEYDNDDNPYG